MITWPQTWALSCCVALLTAHLGRQSIFYNCIFKNLAVSSSCTCHKGPNVSLDNRSSCIPFKHWLVSDDRMWCRFKQRGYWFTPAIWTSVEESTERGSLLFHCVHTKCQNVFASHISSLWRKTKASNRGLNGFFMSRSNNLNITCSISYWRHQ